MEFYTAQLTAEKITNLYLYGDIENPSPSGWLTLISVNWARYQYADHSDFLQNEKTIAYAVPKIHKFGGTRLSCVGISEIQS